MVTEPNFNIILVAIGIPLSIRNFDIFSIFDLLTSLFLLFISPFNSDTSDNNVVLYSSEIASLSVCFISFIISSNTFPILILI